jgi:hypothetical protein
LLVHCRINTLREFFRISPDEAKRVIAGALGQSPSDARVPRRNPDPEGTLIRLPKDYCSHCGRIKSRCSCSDFDESKGE